MTSIWGPCSWEAFHSTLHEDCSWALWKRARYDALQRDRKAQTFYWAYKVMSVMRLQDRLLAWLPLPVVIVKEVYGLWDPFAFLPDDHSNIWRAPEHLYSVPTLRVHTPKIRAHRLLRKRREGHNHRQAPRAR